MAGIFAIFLILGLLAPSRYLEMRATSRKLALRRAFPEAIDLMVTCIDAGLGMEQALSRVALELGHGEPVLAEELRVTVRELETGMPVGEAMRRLARRTGVEEIENFCTIVAQATTLGAKLAQTLRDYSTSSRRRRISELEEVAGKASTRVTMPLILCLIPACLVFILGPAALSLARNMVDM
jgi:tight adherence protein C